MPSLTIFIERMGIKVIKDFPSNGGITGWRLFERRDNRTTYYLSHIRLKDVELTETRNSY
jgi:hypothetical protein